MRLEKILIPTDFSDSAARAVQQAAVLARKGGIELQLLHWLASPVPLFSAAAPPGAAGFMAYGDMLEDFLTQLREEAAEQMKGIVDGLTKEGIRVETIISENADAHEAIERQAESWGADLVILGSHGRTGVDKLLMGSVAEKVLRHGSTDVMLLRVDSALFGESDSLGEVLVPVDFSEHSQRALGRARGLVERFGGSLHLVHVVELLHTPLKPGGLTNPFDADPELHPSLMEALEGMLGDSEGKCSVLAGSTSGQILWQREHIGAQVVVMGSRGRSGMARLLVGSVAEQVVRFCEVPVIVVK